MEEFTYKPETIIMFWVIGALFVATVGYAIWGEIKARREHKDK